MPKRSDRIGTIKFGSMPVIADLAALVVAGGASLTLTHSATIVKAQIRGRFLPDTTSTPVLFGLASDELTASEVEEYLEVVGPNEPTQVPEGELISRGRLIKELGMCPPNGEPIANQVVSLDLAEPLTLSIREGHGVFLWAYNLGPAALGSGAAVVGRVTCVVRWHAN